MLDGNWERFRDVNGVLIEEDAASLYSMLLEIPVEFPEEKREAFRERLVGLLCGIPGDTSSSYLHEFIKREEFIEDRSWVNAVTLLGHRKFAVAAPYLESRAFGKDHRGQVMACAALLLIDPAQYVARTAEAMRSTSNPYAVTRFLAAFRNVTAGPTSPDIAQAVPALQEVFRARGREARNSRPLIVGILVSYVTNYKSEPTRVWLLSELRSVLDSSDESFTPEERATYRAILDQLGK